MSRQASKLEKNTSVYSYTLTNLTLSDSDQYSCFANNSLGDDSASMTINVTLPRTFTNVTSCCKAVGISSDCLPLCSQDIDLDWFSVTSQCLSQFPKVMSCAAAGSDHRHCCQEKGLPTEALDWCRGTGGTETVVLALAFSQIIQGCFHQGQGQLPGPPSNLSVKVLSPSEALVFWNQPIKNPEAVEIYRVFWRPVSDERVNKVNTMQMNLHLNELVVGASYEVAVKAANGKGTSQLTEPLVFEFTGATFLPTSTSKTSPLDSSWQDSPEMRTLLEKHKLMSSQKRTYILTASFVLLFLLSFFVVFFLLERRRRNTSSDRPSVAFDNPLDESGRLSEDAAVEIRTPTRTPSPRGLEMETPLPDRSSVSRAAGALQSIFSFPRAGGGFKRFQ